MAFEDPAPREAPGLDSDTVAPRLPLPEGPILFAVVAPPGGAPLRAMAIARFSGSVVSPLEFPAIADETFRARFDSVFLAPSAQLPLHADGRRIGTLVLGSERTVPRAACASVVEASALLVPGSSLPPLMLAVTAPLSAALPESLHPTEPNQRIRTFGPILAEQILREAGESRPFLARRASLAALDFEGDAAPAMAATYLINDKLGGPPPSGEAVSLFFLARFDPARGYVPVWSIFRRYEAASREIYSYGTGMRGPRGRLDFLIRSDGTSRRLAASADTGAEGGARRVEWVEAGECPSLDLLEEGSPAVLP